MAVPKKKSSKSRSRKRRTNWKLDMPPLSSCSHCGAMKRPHFVCSECGYYGDRMIITPKAD